MTGSNLDSSEDHSLLSDHKYQVKHCCTFSHAEEPYYPRQKYQFSLHHSFKPEPLHWKSWQERAKLVPKGCGFCGMGTCPLGSALKPPTHFTCSTKEPSDVNNVQSLLTQAGFWPRHLEVKYCISYHPTPCHKSIANWNQHLLFFFFLFKCAGFLWKTFLTVFFIGKCTVCGVFSCLFWLCI